MSKNLSRRIWAFYWPIYRPCRPFLFCFFFFGIFSHGNVGYISQLPIYRRYWAIVSVFFFKRLSFAKIILRRLDTRYITIFLSSIQTRQLFTCSNYFFFKYKFKDILWDSPFKKTVNQLKNISISIFFLQNFKIISYSKITKKKKEHF